MSPRTSASRRGREHRNCRMPARPASERIRPEWDSVSYCRMECEQRLYMGAARAWEEGSCGTSAFRGAERFETGANGVFCNKQRGYRRATRSRKGGSAGTLAFRASKPMTDEVHVKTSNHNRYLVKSLVHASRVLEAFQSSGDVLRLRDVGKRTGFNKGMCFPFLYTLHQCGFLDKVGENHYRLASEVRRRRLYRSGYAAQGQDTSFDREVRDGLVRAAEREHVELIVVDNRYQPKIALRNADYLIKEQVDLVVEFQTDELIAPAIATKYLEANIPFIAIDIPHPGATYFGANNYQAGLMAGHYLGRYAKKHWDGEPDEILLVELHRAGSLPQGRCTSTSRIS